MTQQKTAQLTDERQMQARILFYFRLLAAAYDNLAYVNTKANDRNIKLGGNCYHNALDYDKHKAPTAVLSNQLMEACNEFLHSTYHFVMLRSAVTLIMAWLEINIINHMEDPELYNDDLHQVLEFVEAQYNRLKD